MNDLIGNNYEPSEEQLKAKKWMKIIGIILVILLFICIGLIVLMYYIQASQLKITIDGKDGTKLQEILKIEGDKVYVPIRQFASYVGYESYSGDYKQYAEDNTKCYVQSNDEIASFTMDSDKIYKILVGSNDYEYFTIDEPVKMIDGVLYTTMEGAERAFNISFSYNKNQITIYTLPYLVTYWSGKITNSAIADEGANFSNQKAILENRIIVKNADGYYGVYDLTGKEILGTKYASIEYIESTKEFIVTTAEKKMGIMSYDASIKISPEYDEIKQIDKNAGLYLVTNNKKQGVINHSGSIIVYLDYDQIGIDASKYTTNNIKNQYLLYDNCIPVKRNNKWGMFDKSGREILPLEYEEFGCSAGSGIKGDNTISANSILLIPKYEGIVVKKDTLYGLVDKNGKELAPIVLKSIYSTTTSGEETYYMVYGEQIMNLSNYVDARLKNEENTNNQNNNNNVNTNNIDNSNNVINNENNINNVNTVNETVPTSANTVSNTNSNQTNVNTTGNTTSTNSNVSQNVVTTNTNN